jgi:hypothetical protein
MRILTNQEAAIISGAAHPRIVPNDRWFSNEYGMDANWELTDYIYENHGSIPLVGALPAGFVNDMAELYYRSVSYEDAFWRNAKNASIGAVLLGIGFAMGRFIPR